MGKTENPHFHYFRIFGAVPDPPNQCDVYLETPEYLKSFQEKSQHMKNVIHQTPWNLGIKHFENLEIACTELVVVFLC